MLYDFIVSKIEDIEYHYPEKLAPVKRALLRQKPQLLSFVEAMNDSVEIIAKEHEVSNDVCWQMSEMLRYKLRQRKTSKN